MKFRHTRWLLALGVLILIGTFYFYTGHLPSFLRNTLSSSSSFNEKGALLDQGIISTRNHHKLDFLTASSTRTEGDVPTIDLQGNISALVEVAQGIQRRHGVVLFCMINDAYFDFAASWCCNTGWMEDVHSRVLFLTTDVDTGRRLKSRWTNVSVVALSEPHFSGFREYSKAGHVRMMTERTRFILRMLEAGVRVLLFEVDCLWLKDPLPLVLSHSQNNTDIVGTHVAERDYTAAGFLFLIPTPTTLKFWGRLTADLDRLVESFRKHKNSQAVSESGNEQMYFSNLARKKFAGIKIAYLPVSAFPDGKWYALSAEKRERSSPVLINNNWVVGKVGKRTRAMAFGHWFWDEATQKCNASAVDRLFRSG